MWRQTLLVPDEAALEAVRVAAGVELPGAPLVWPEANALAALLSSVSGSLKPAPAPAPAAEPSATLMTEPGSAEYTAALPFQARSDPTDPAF